MSYPITFAVKRSVGDTPMGVQELLNLIANNLVTNWAPSGIITGQLGGILPTTNVGPWSNNGEWWFWNPSTASYARGAEGVPVGMIAIWAGTSVPVNWLLCDGSAVPIATYPALWAAIGGSWGSTATTFTLPPASVFYMNCDASFHLEAANQPTVSGKRDGWGVQGGSQLAPLLTNQLMPPLFAKVSWLPRPKKQPGIYGLSILQPPGQAGAENWTFQVTDSTGLQLNNQDQTQFSIMPPFVAANHIIKYQ